MVRYVVDIEKKYGEEYFTNIYHCTVIDRAGAEEFALAVANREKAICRAEVGFIKARVRPDTGPGAVGSVVALGFNGALASGTDYMPLFNVARVDFLTATGRPSRKYLRIPLRATDCVGNGGIYALTRTGIITGYITPMLADERFCDPQTEPFTSGLVLPAIGMRQLRRGAKAKKPVLPGA